MLEKPVASERSQASPSTILLTGASGYLGRFLCLTLLSSLAQNGGKLICIARGKDDAVARQRLARSFESRDHSLSQKFTTLSEEHLEVFAVDIGLPRLGLDDSIWERVSKEADTIVHAGAHVNHLLTYSQLFDANVLGTTELIELALTDRRKKFVFISSIAVAAPLGERAAIDEESDIRIALPKVAVDRNYANGYATSKWAGEVLLREANEKYDLPVTVFRSSMILAHRDYAEELL
ncbi:SDR family oxidoreductase [Agrobacterium vitis]|uniref:SDR family oxidoreductase n=1 Tax=Agrobacterium vitis TaxID=373 RepID=UPI003D2A735B